MSPCIKVGHSICLSINYHHYLSYTLFTFLPDPPALRLLALRFLKKFYCDELVLVLLVVTRRGL